MTARLTTWKQDVAGLGAIALIAAAAWFLVLAPRADARKQADNLRLQTDLLRSQVAMIEAQARAARTDLRAAESAPSWARGLRPASDFNRVLAALNQAAAEAGVTIDQLTPGPRDQEPEMIRRRISLAGRGEYLAAAALLATIRDEFPDVSVVAISASRGSSESGGAAVLSLELAWHAQPEPADGPARNPP